MEKRMIDKNIWMEILKLTSQSQSKGEALYLDGLKKQFPENQLEYNIKYLVDHGLIVKNLTNLDDSFGYSELTTTGYDFWKRWRPNSRSKREAQHYLC